MIRSKDILEALSRGAAPQEEKLSAQTLAKMLDNDEPIVEKPTNDLTKLASQAIEGLKQDEKVTVGDLLSKVFDNKEAITADFSQEEKLASLRVQDPHEDLISLMPKYCLEPREETAISKLASLSGDTDTSYQLSTIDQSILDLYRSAVVKDTISKTASINMFTEGFSTEETGRGSVGLFLMKRFGML